MCFVLTLDKDTLKEEFDLIKNTMSYIVQEYGCQSANYCVILRKNNEFINFEERCSYKATLKNRISELEQPSSPALLFEDLETACRAFKSPNVRKDAKKVRYMHARPMSAALSSLVIQQGRVGLLFNHWLVIGSW